MDVRAYFDAAQRLGTPYSSAGSVRTEVLSLLQTPADARLPLRCEKIALQLACTARERSRERYWWASYDAQTMSYRLSDLDRQQPREELIGNLHGLCEQLQTPNSTLTDLAPVLALMTIDMLRLSVACKHFVRRENMLQSTPRSA